MKIKNLKTYLKPFLATLAFLFLWFQIRPIAIRMHCQKQYDGVMENDGNTILRKYNISYDHNEKTQVLRKEAEAVYKTCTRRWGLK